MIILHKYIYIYFNFVFQTQIITRFERTTPLSARARSFVHLLAFVLISQVCANAFARWVHSPQIVYIHNLGTTICVAVAVVCLVPVFFYFFFQIKKNIIAFACIAVHCIPSLYAYIHMHREVQVITLIVARTGFSKNILETWC